MKLRLRAKAVITILVVVALVAALTVISRLGLKSRIAALAVNQSCISRTETRTVRGSSLSGFIEEGSTIKIQVGYYSCNKVERGDVVAYQYPGNQEPVIKIVKAIPGDKFELKNNGQAWRIVVNGEIVKNAQGLPYQLDERAYRLLSLYVNDYKGVVPADAYLLLGNIPTGSADSTHYGLVGKSDIMGRVVY